MDKDLLNFINGNTNYYCGDMSIGREPVNGGKDFFILTCGNVTIATFWSDIGKPSKVGSQETALEEIPGAPPKKKTMGGKKAYVMLMTAKMGEMVQSGKATPEQIGCLAVLTPHIEWGTGRLLKKRSKKSLQSKDICTALKMPSRTWNRKFGELKEIGLMSLDDNGYYISTDLFKKGGLKE